MALRPPPINATLLAIFGQGITGTDPYGNEVFGDVERWSGTAPAFSTEKHENTPWQGGTVLVRTATIAIPATLPVEPGDSITFTHHGVEQTRVVDAAEDRADAGFNRLFMRDAG